MFIKLCFCLSIHCSNHLFVWNEYILSCKTCSFRYNDLYYVQLCITGPESRRQLIRFSRIMICRRWCLLQILDRFERRLSVHIAYRVFIFERLVRTILSHFGFNFRYSSWRFLYLIVTSYVASMDNGWWYGVPLLRRDSTPFSWSHNKSVRVR